MANGTQIAEENFQRFVKWISAKTNADFKVLERRGLLNRTEISRECGFARSVLSQNPRIKARLQKLEAELRVQGVLLPANEGNEGDVSAELPSGETSAHKRMVGSARLSSLEQDNAALLQENAELKRQLSKFTMLQNAFSLTGRIPR